eukprot:gene17225-18946_t
MDNNDRRPKDIVTYFPAEIVEMIFSNLSPEAIYASLQASKPWNEFIETDDIIWKTLCSTFDINDIREDMDDGISWKVIFMKNHGTQGVTRRWLKGKYSNLKCGDWEFFTQERLFDTIDVETWGLILDAELKRNSIDG